MKRGEMIESKIQLSEFGYLYYSLYAYRRKIESDIKNIIKIDSEATRTGMLTDQESSKNLYNLTKKLQTISFITSKVITLNKGYRRSV